MGDATLEVVRDGGATSIICRACMVECKSVGKTTVEALVRLPCSQFRIDATVDAEEKRNVHD